MITLELTDFWLIFGGVATVIASFWGFKVVRRLLSGR